MKYRSIFEFVHHLEELIDEVIEIDKEIKDLRGKEFEKETEVEDILSKLESLEIEDGKHIKSDLEENESLEEERMLNKLEGSRQEIEKAINSLEDEKFTEAYQFMDNVLHPLVIINSNTGNLEKERKIASDVESKVRNLSRIQSKVSELTERAKKIIDKLENDDQELKGLIEEISDEELEEECKILWKNTQKARDSLENEQYQDLFEYLKSLQNILNHILEDAEAHDFSDYKVDEENIVGEGAEAKVYSIKNAPNKLLRVTEGSIENLVKHKRMINQVPENVNIAKPLKVGEYKDQPAEIVERAPGHETHIATRAGVKKSDYSPEEIYENWSALNSEFAKAPQEHFDKLVRDTKVLSRYSINPDPQGCNLFYHEDEGFTWIDLSIYNYTGGNYGIPSLIALVGSIKSVVEFSNKGFLEQEDLDNLLKIYEKMEKAGFLTGPNEREKEIIEDIRQEKTEFSRNIYDASDLFS